MTSQRTVPSLLSRLLRLACRILIFFPRLYLRLLVRLLPMEWLGRAKISFTHHPNPISILEKDGRRTDLVKICKATVPRCQMNPLLPNGNIQTMWTATKNHGPHIYYRRRVFEADHSTYHGTFAVDFVVDPFEGEDDSLPPRTVYFSDAEFEGLSSDDSRPMLIVLHGLSGGSHEVYLRYAIEPLVKGDRKWEICVVNSRGCANSRITSGVLYNARATWDVRQFVRWAREKFSNRPLFGLGFSLGANIMTNVRQSQPVTGARLLTDSTQYLAEEGHGCLLEAAVVCGNPFNLDLSSKLMQKNFLGKNVYLKVMGSELHCKMRSIESIADERSLFSHSIYEKPGTAPQGGNTEVHESGL